MIPQHAQDQWLLTYTMSSISERCWYASWLDNIEYVLWHSLEKGPRRYGHDEINAGDIIALKMLSERFGCWVFFDDINEETALPLNLWREKYARHIENNPHAIV
jgi:hypothetical protein